MTERRLNLALVLSQFWWHVLHAELSIKVRFSLYQNCAPRRLCLPHAELFNSLLCQFQISFRCDLFEPLQVRFRSSRVQQSVCELIGLHRKERRPESFAENN